MWPVASEIGVLQLTKRRRKRKREVDCFANEIDCLILRVITTVYTYDDSMLSRLSAAGLPLAFRLSSSNVLKNR
jgi:hypothetical protein